MSEPTGVLFDGENDSLRLEFADVGAASAFVQGAIEQQGFLVSVDRELKQHQAVRVRLEVPGALEVELAAEVAQRFGAGAETVPTAFLLRDWSEERDRDVRSALTKAEERSRAEQVLEDRAEEDEAEADPKEPVTVGEARGISAAHEIRKLNPAQKAHLATRADRAERQVLLRETAPRVLESLLVNPRIEGKDVLQIVKSTHATAAILQRVAQDPRWGKNQEILATVAKNPKTPTPLATRLIEKLRTSDLRVMSKMSGGMRDVVRRAALREYLKRGAR